MPEIALLIPCYKESERLPTFLPDLCECLKKSGLPVSILVVDDGSGKTEQDKLTKIIADIRQKYGFVEELICLPKNLGKGGAIYHGWEKSLSCDYLAFADADGAVSANEVLRVLKEIFESKDKQTLYYATRDKDSKNKVKRKWTRKIGASFFNFCIRTLFHIPTTDTQCGLKILPTELFVKSKPLLKEKGFCFDIELILAAQHFDYKLKDIPINWEEKGGSRLSIWHAIKMHLTLLKIKSKFSRNN